MERKKVFVGYEVIEGVIFAKYKKQIVEDDGSITPDGLHRETFTQEAYDVLKRADFIDKVLLNHATEKHAIAVDRDEARAERDALRTELSAKDAEIAVLKKAKK